MKIKVDNEFLEICKMIISENKSIEEWQEVESDDYFQSDQYVGGFDATENAFCFSYYDTNRNEFWFQISIGEVENILDRRIKELEVRIP